jgi:hypothetical protein
MQALHPNLPNTYLTTRDALHRVAEQLVAPARKPHNEIALGRTPGGFGTPKFEFDGETTQVRVDGAALVVERDSHERRIELTSLAEAGRELGAELLPDGAPGDAAPLAIDAAAAARLADFYAFADGVLRAFRDSLAPDDQPSDINLWPEHFDIAFEAGPEAEGLRANYGASPGDEGHAEPYLYVGPWNAEAARGELWNATGFTGAELSYRELAAAADQRTAALEFLRSRRAALSG